MNILNDGVSPINMGFAHLPVASVCLGTFLGDYYAIGKIKIGAGPWNCNILSGQSVASRARESF